MLTTWLSVLPTQVWDVIAHPSLSIGVIMDWFVLVHLRQSLFTIRRLEYGSKVSVVKSF